MRKAKLTKEEKAVEDRRKEYAEVTKSEFKEIVQAIQARKKDAVLNIRINKKDLESLKQKAAKVGVKYQTLISEVLHRLAQS